MAYIFGDSFDLYATPADATLGYWDGGTGGSTLIAGRFTGSQAVRIQSAANTHIKNSSVTTDPVHHIVCAFRQTAALSGSTLGNYFQLSDGATNQCCIVFRSDGAILLTSATPAGTVLDTYTGAITANNTWFGLEFEVVINNTTGSWAIRKNGNTVNDHSLGGLITRPGANTQANKLTVGASGVVVAQDFDDLLWRSDASSVAWVGDIRCYTRMPASDVGTVQFSRSPSTSTNAIAGTTTASDPTGTAKYTSFTPTFNGTVGSILVGVNTGFTGNMKCSIFADSSGPAAVLGSATTITNPTTGTNTFTFGTPVTVAAGTLYWLGVSHDVTAVLSVGGGTAHRQGTGIAYASFPTPSPVTVTGVAPIASTVVITLTSNSECVNEAQQDGTTTYVYDSTVNDADFYTIGAAATTPATVVAVTTRGFIEKSDAGTRTGSIQLKSGATTVATTTVTLSTSFGWAWRTDVTDPNTSATWTASAVNSVQIGPRVIS